MYKILNTGSNYCGKLDFCTADKLISLEVGESTLVSELTDDMKRAQYLTYLQITEV